MKNIKKVLALTLALVMVLASFSVLAEEPAEKESEIKVYESKVIKLDDALEDQEKWIIPEGKNVVFEDGKVINKQPEFLMFSYDEPEKNTIAQMDVSLNLLNDEGKGTWTGIAVRSNSKTARAWNEGGESYLFIVKFDRIELQKWHKYNQTILAVVPNDGYIKDDEFASVSVGAIDTDEGVNIFMYVDDVCVVNICDADKGEVIAEDDNITFYATEGSAIGKYTGPEKLPSAPTMPVVSIDENDEFKVNAKYALVSFGEDTDTDVKYNIRWYHSFTKDGDNISEMLYSAINEFGVKYVGAPGDYNKLDATGESFEVPPMLTGEYFRACIEDEKGNKIVGSLPVACGKAHVIERKSGAIMENAVVLEVGSSDAFVNGKLVLIDANDKSVKPKVTDGRTLVPVRFISESLGAEVSWDEETEEVTIELDGKKIVMTIGEKTYTVDGVKKELDVPATTISSRTMVPVRAISEAFGKHVFWEDYYNIILISDEDYGLDPDEDIEIIYYMARRLGE